MRVAKVKKEKAKARMVKVKKVMTSLDLVIMKMQEQEMVKEKLEKMMERPPMVLKQSQGMKVG